VADFHPAELAAASGGTWTGPEPRQASGFCIDTRELQPGDVFVALPGTTRDGHDFLLEAAGRGAAAALVSKPNREAGLPQLVVGDVEAAFQAIATAWRQRFRGPVLGVTGSCGKTSTKDLLAILFGGEAGGVLATRGNLNNQLGVPLTLLRLDSRHHRFAVIEAGISGPGDMDTLAGMIQPNHALVTLVAAAHLERLGSLEGVAREKSRLLAAVASSGVAAFPSSCWPYAVFRELAADAVIVHPLDQPLPEGLDRPVHAYAWEETGERSRLRLQPAAGAEVSFDLRRVSRGQAANAALALATALRLGVPAARLQERLNYWQPARFRGQALDLGSVRAFVDCYNANPASMADSLEHFLALSAGRPRLAVLGCMEELGPDSGRWHEELGQRFRFADADLVFAIGGQAEALRRGLLAAGNAPEQIVVAAELEPIRRAIAGFSGELFLKGSRRYRLEALLDDLVAPSKPKGATC
jgi:UDP-N-acetylmuramoyl-tripeptide--D-alanyl-D-alanine ligase